MRRSLARVKSALMHELESVRRDYEEEQKERSQLQSHVTVVQVCARVAHALNEVFA